MRPSRWFCPRHNTCESFCFDGIFFIMGLFWIDGIKVAYLVAMFIRPLHIIGVVALISIVLPSATFGNDSGLRCPTTLYEYKIMKLINQARVNPARMARLFGVDPDEVCRENPELKTVFEWGLPPLNFDPALRNASELHALDMIKRGYYSDVTPEGVGVKARVSSAGYGANDSDELLGILLFSNYCEQEKAVNEMFRKMFLGELSKNQKRRRIILNASFRDVGMSVKSGNFVWKGDSYNAYIAVCDFGIGEDVNSRLALVKRQLFHMINQARRDPGRVTTAGVSKESAESRRTDDTAGALPSFATSYHPFEWSAWAGCVDAVIERSYSDVKPEERLSYRERMALFFGFGDAVGSLAARHLSAYPDNDNRPVVEALFKELLMGSQMAQSLVLKREMTESGISIRRDLEWLDGEGRIVYTATLEIGKPVETTVPVINGVVFSDSDGNGLYSPGEGLADIPIIIFDAGIHLRTDSVGGFESIVSAGEAYRIICFGNDGNLLISETDAINNHTSIFFNVSETGKGGERPH